MKLLWCVCALSRVQPFVPTRLLCAWDSPGKNTGVGCHALLQGTFPTQGWNPCLLHLLHSQADSLPLEPPGRACALNIYLKSHYSSFTLLPVLSHRSRNCQAIRQAFMSAFISKDPCKATKEDYNSLINLAPPTVPCGQVTGAKLWI